MHTTRLTNTSPTARRVPIGPGKNGVGTARNRGKLVLAQRRILQTRMIKGVSRRPRLGHPRKTRRKIFGLAALVQVK